jgi:hypothetical protein
MTSSPTRPDIRYIPFPVLMAIDLDLHCLKAVKNHCVFRHLRESLFISTARHYMYLALSNYEVGVLLGRSSGQGFEGDALQANAMD